MFLTEKEYHIHLFTLRLNDEIELLNKVITINQDIYPVDDEFDLWVRVKFRELEGEKSGRGSFVYDDLYLLNMMKVVHFLTRHLKTTKENVSNNENKIFGIDAYIERIKPQVIDSLHTGHEKSKEVSYFGYEKGSVFRPGDIFGSYNLDSKILEKR